MNFVLFTCYCDTDECSTLSKEFGRRQSHLFSYWNENKTC